MTYKDAAKRIGCSPARVSREARELGIPYPLTEDDMHRLGFRIHGPYGGMPRFRRLTNRHFEIVRAA